MIVSNKNILITMLFLYQIKRLNVFVTLEDADRLQATKRRVTFHSLITVINVSYGFQFHVKFGCKCCRQELLVCHVQL